MTDCETTTRMTIEDLIAAMCGESIALLRQAEQCLDRMEAILDRDRKPRDDGEAR